MSGSDAAPDSAFHEYSRIEQVLGPKLVARPLAIASEFDTQEVSCLTINAVPDHTLQHSIAVMNGQTRALQDLILALETDARKRNIFQIHRFGLQLASLVAPLHPNQIRAKQTRLRSLFTHDDLIGNPVTGPECATNCEN